MKYSCCGLAWSHRLWQYASVTKQYHADFLEWKFGLLERTFCFSPSLEYNSLASICLCILRKELWMPTSFLILFLFLDFAGDHTGRVGGDHVLCDGCPFILQFYLLYLADNCKYKTCCVSALQAKSLQKSGIRSTQILAIWISSWNLRNPAWGFSPRFYGRIMYLWPRFFLFTQRNILRIENQYQCRIMCSSTHLLSKQWTQK